MATHYIPRNVQGEGRILFIFTRKSLIFSVVGAVIGLIFYGICSLAGLNFIGIIITAFFALVGFAIGTFKMPEITFWEFTKKTGGENIDDIIMRYFKFKKRKNRIYIYNKEETKDE